MQWSRAVTLCLGLAFFAGCGSRPDRRDQLAACRSVFIMRSISGGLTDTSFRLEEALQSSASRALSARGYRVVDEGTAQATLRMAWIIGRDTDAGGQDERTLTLSLSIFSRSGDRVYSARSPVTLPERMWSEDRVAAEVAQMLRNLPEASVPGLAPAEGKPALAPIRLK